MVETTQTQTRVSGAECVQNHLIMDNSEGKRLNVKVWGILHMVYL